MRVAVVGIGAVAPMHIQALKQNGESVVGLCDIELDRAREANEQFDLNAELYTDYVHMLDSIKPEVVHICTPHYLHASMICEALQRNIHVFCEKPLAISEEELVRIEKTLDSSTAKLGVCQQNRYKSAMKYVKQFFEGKTITSANGTLIWERNESYYHSGEWRGKKSTEGGGVMINQALHTLDLLQWFCGMPKTVKAHISNLSLENVIDVEDTAYGLFKLENGGNFVLFATNSARIDFAVNITLSTGEDTVQVSGDNIIINGQFVTKEDGLPLYGKTVWGVGHQLIISDFYNCLHSGKKFAVDFSEGQKVVRMILKMYESNGKELPL